MKLPLQGLFLQTRTLSFSNQRYARTPFGMNRTPTGLPKRSVEDRYRETLDLHKHRRLELAQPSGRMDQWKLSPKKPDPIIKKNERKLSPLSESNPPYAKYSEEAIERIEKFETFYDPLFNPHIDEERYKVNPEEEPFDAIYVDSKSKESHQYTETRNITTPQLWEYVESLSRIKIAPEPIRRKPGDPIAALPSGFVPPPEIPPDLPYFVPRTRNHLLPVYYWLDSDAEKCLTIVKQVSGDLWKFEEDLRNYLESLSEKKKRILTSVRETDATVGFKGKHIREVADWLHNKGF